LVDPDPQIMCGPEPGFVFPKGKTTVDCYAHDFSANWATSSFTVRVLGELVVGGELIPLDTTMVLLAGTQTIAAWMIPVIVSAIGIGIVIARKF